VALTLQVATTYDVAALATSGTCLSGFGAGVPAGPLVGPGAREVHRYRFEKCTEVLRKLAWAVRGAPIVYVAPGRYSTLKRYADDRSCRRSAEMGEGLFMYRADSIDEARKLAEADPMPSSGARDFTVREWMVNEGTHSIRRATARPSR
jgi:hypothetical protein